MKEMILVVLWGTLGASMFMAGVHFPKPTLNATAVMAQQLCKSANQTATEFTKDEVQCTGGVSVKFPEAPSDNP